ncbi:hypothetical protein FV218_21315 [Methylobacterium sp. WL69]|uniref:hypothetical protein n=1 Tax=Methylobacterium sp. WL69 TaxID=2603893 RepID=UPI0011C7E47F|nr:hypothetical protein [Methylobacterium sp. WL69]TXM65430.1 hypothetical protein FV218_21315 [Methylobacterium sp. WL69]
MLKSIRRQGVIADFGSLDTYREHLVYELDAASGDEAEDIRLDLAWVDAEIARDTSDPSTTPRLSAAAPDQCYKILGT